jgi:hypothetical protein
MPAHVWALNLGALLKTYVDKYIHAPYHITKTDIEEAFEPKKNNERTTALRVIS